MCVNTVTLLSFSGKTQILAIWAIISSKAWFGGGACTFLNAYILDRAFSDDKSGILKLQEHHIKNYLTNLKRVETFGHILDPIHPWTFLLVKINEAGIFMAVMISRRSFPIALPYVRALFSALDFHRPV